MKRKDKKVNERGGRKEKNLIEGCREREGV
jgi:hypothetical protein